MMTPTMLRHHYAALMNTPTPLPVLQEISPLAPLSITSIVNRLPQVIVYFYWLALIYVQRHTPTIERHTF